MNDLIVKPSSVKIGEKSKINPDFIVRDKWIKLIPSYHSNISSNVQFVYEEQIEYHDYKNVKKGFQGIVRHFDSFCGRTIDRRNPNLSSPFIIDITAGLCQDHISGETKKNVVYLLFITELKYNKEFKNWLEQFFPKYLTFFRGDFYEFE